MIKNFKEYSIIYNTLNDSLDYYSRNQLSDFFGLVYDKWQVDSLICINSSYNELFATCNVSSTYEKKAWSDEVKMILGKKINTKEQFDSAHWSAIQDKWKHKIDTTEIKKQTDNYN